MRIRDWLCAIQPLPIYVCKDCGGLPEGSSRPIDPLALFAKTTPRPFILELRCGDCKCYWWEAKPPDLPAYRRTIARLARPLLLSKSPEGSTT